MCGIFFILCVNGTIKGIEYRKDILEEYRYNNTQTVVDDSGVRVTYGDSLLVDGGKKFIEICDIDVQGVVNYLRQRGPDSLRGVYYRRVVKKGSSSEFAENNIEVIDLDGNDEIKNEELVKAYLKKVVGGEPEGIMEGCLVENNVVAETFFGISSVLSLRKDSKGNVVKQPIVGDSCCLLYNGEIFCVDIDLFDINLEKKTVDPCLALKIRTHLDSFVAQGSDTIFLHTLLSLIDSVDDIEYHLSIILPCLTGEFSFVASYFNRSQHFIVKDQMGKRSLLVGSLKNGMVFSSCLPLKLDANLGLDTFTKKIELSDLQEKYYGNYLNALDSKMVELPANLIHSMKIPSDCIVYNNTTLDHWFKNVLQQEIPVVVKVSRDEAKGKIKEKFFDSVKKIIDNLHGLVSHTSAHEDIDEKELEMIENGMEDDNQAKEDESLIKKTKDSFMDKTQINPSEIEKKTPESVSIQLTNSDEKARTNAKISVMFSGGLDSSLIVHFLSKILPSHEEYHEFIQDRLNEHII